MNKEEIIQLLDIALEAGQKIAEIYATSDFGIAYKDDKSPLTLADKAAHNIIVKGLSQFSYPILSEEGREIAFTERKTWNRFWMVDPLDGTKEFIKKNDEFTVNIALIENGEPIFGIVYAPILRELFYGGKNIGAFKRLYSEGLSDEKFSIDSTTYSEHQIRTVKPTDQLIVVASRSHLNEDTLSYIKEVQESYSETDFRSKGSSLKLVLVAEGKAHLYPRCAPTMEWDTAAGHAVAVAAGARVTQIDGTALVYNKKNLLNPHFVVSALG